MPRNNNSVIMVLKSIGVEKGEWSISVFRGPHTTSCSSTWIFLSLSHK